MNGRDQPGGLCGFDPAWTARRIAAWLAGRRWETNSHGLLEVTAVEPVEVRWPIELRLTLANDDWPAPHVYLVEFDAHDTLASASPEGNAEHLAEEALSRIEQHLDRGSMPAVVELSRPAHLRPG